MKILIAGQPKTGTTALFSKIYNSIEDTRILFEPKIYKPDDSRSNKFELAKILLSPSHEVDYDSFDFFDKKIILVRDPRDRLISTILYSVRHSNFYTNKIKLEKFISLLRKKEADPKSVPVAQIIKLFDELNKVKVGYFLQGFTKIDQFAQNFHDNNKNYFLVRYEDLVDEKLDSLAEYLELNLHGETIVDKSLNRVVRTKSYGSWKNWLTKSDCEVFNPIMSSYLDRYGYSHDWDLAEKPSIKSEHGSEYVERIVDGKIKEDKVARQSTRKKTRYSIVLSYFKWRLNKLLG